MSDVKLSPEDERRELLRMHADADRLAEQRRVEIGSLRAINTVERDARLAAEAGMSALATALEALVRAVEHDHNVGMFVEDARTALRQAWRLP